MGILDVFYGGSDPNPKPLLKCRICGKEDAGVVEIPYMPDRPLVAHESCFVEWAKRVLEIVEMRRPRD